ncbi:MAG: hypothetical protein AB1567_07925, partial [bacterium]
MKKLIINGLLVSLACIFFGVFIHYHRTPLNLIIFYLQKLFRYWSFDFVWHNIQEFFLLIVLILSAAGIGYKLLKLFKLNFYSVLVEFIFSLGLGLGFFSLITLGLGLSGMLFPVVFYVLVLCSLLLSYVEIKYFLIHWGQTL